MGSRKFIVSPKLVLRKRFIVQLEPKDLGANFERYFSLQTPSDHSKTFSFSKSINEKITNIFYKKNRCLIS